MGDDSIQTYVLVWLDTSANSESNNETRSKLQSLFYYPQIFENIHQVETHLRDTSLDQIIVVTHDDFAEELMKTIHFLPKIWAIYIHATNRQFNEQWIQQHYKVIHNVAF